MSANAQTIGGKMYRIVFNDYIEHIDPEFESYADACEAYINAVSCCMRYGITVDITLLDESSADIRAFTTCAGNEA